MKERAIRMIESCGFHARNGLRLLEKKISHNDSILSIAMNDHIEEMGKNIVRRLHPNEPNRRSLLWIDEEIKDILANDSFVLRKDIDLKAVQVPPVIILEKPLLVSRYT